MYAWFNLFGLSKKKNILLQGLSINNHAIIFASTMLNSVYQSLVIYFYFLS